MVADAVAVEPVSTPKFPANREINREFYQIRPPCEISKANTRAISMPFSQIPYATEQGIISAEQGILDCTPGGEQGLGCWIDSLVGVLILELDRAPISER